MYLNKYRYEPRSKSIIYAKDIFYRYRFWGRPYRFLAFCSSRCFWHSHLHCGCMKRSYLLAEIRSNGLTSLFTARLLAADKALQSRVGLRNLVYLSLSSSLSAFYLLGYKILIRKFSRRKARPMSSIGNLAVSSAGSGQVAMKAENISKRLSASYRIRYRRSGHIESGFFKKWLQIRKRTTQQQKY